MSALQWTWPGCASRFRLQPRPSSLKCAHCLGPHLCIYICWHTFFFVYFDIFKIFAIFVILILWKWTSMSSFTTAKCPNLKIPTRTRFKGNVNNYRTEHGISCIGKRKARLFFLSLVVLELAAKLRYTCPIGVWSIALGAQLTSIRPLRCHRCPCRKCVSE